MSDPCHITYICPSAWPGGPPTHVSLGERQCCDGTYFSGGDYWSPSQPTDERCRKVCDTDWYDEHCGQTSGWDCGQWGTTIKWFQYYPGPCGAYRECAHSIICELTWNPDIVHYEFYPGVDVDDQIITDRLNRDCQKGACCFVDPLVCSVECESPIWERDCVERGGIPHLGKQCSDVDCQEGSHPCCFCSGKCEILPTEVCELMGGVPKYWGDCYQRCVYPGHPNHPCRSELYGPGQRIDAHQPPFAMEHRVNTWELVSRRGLKMFGGQDRYKQHYGRMSSRPSRYSNMSSGMVCTNPQGGMAGGSRELSNCPVVVQTDDNICNDNSLRPGYVTFACPVRCGCEDDPC